MDTIWGRKKPVRTRKKRQEMEEIQARYNGIQHESGTVTSKINWGWRDGSLVKFLPRGPEFDSTEAILIKLNVLAQACDENWGGGARPIPGAHCPASLVYMWTAGQWDPVSKHRMDASWGRSMVDQWHLHATHMCKYMHHPLKITAETKTKQHKQRTPRD